MGLRSDVDDVRQRWSDASFWLKAWLVLSGFVAVSSLASLSETIIKWKGFIRDGFAFVHGLVSAPFRDLLAACGVHITPVAVDLLVVSIILVTSYVRAEVITDTGNRAYQKINLAGAFILALSIGFCIWRLNNVPVTKVSWQAVLLMIGVPLAVPLVFRLDSFKLYYAQLIVIVLVVGIAGAFNSALK